MPRVQSADQPPEVPHGLSLQLVGVLTIDHHPGHIVVGRVQGLSLHSHSVLQLVALSSLCRNGQSFVISQSAIPWHIS